MGKILVTGVTGLVGSGFVVSLLRQNPTWRVVCLVRSNAVTTARQRVEKILTEQCAFEGCPLAAPAILANVEVVDGDVTTIVPEKLVQLPELSGVDRVFHCAADVNLGKDPTGKTFNINFGGTTHMLEVAKLLRVKEFHYVSTAYVAGKLDGRAMEAEAIDSGFNNPYEESKFKSEKLVRNCGIPFTIYRPAIITGRLSDGRVRRPLAFYRIVEFLAKLKQNRCVKEHLNPSDWVDMHLHFKVAPSERIYFVPIDYVVKAITALFQKPVCNRTYHCTGNSPVTTMQIQHAICNILKMRAVEISPLEKVGDRQADDKLMGRLLGDLFPYFSSNITFDQTNVVDALGPEFIDWQFGEDGLQRIIKAFYRDFFDASDWLKQIIGD